MAHRTGDDVRHAAAGAHAVAIRPATHWLPANILRFYKHFSEPAEVAFERSELQSVTAEGLLVSDAFLLLNDELWSPDGRRLTVFMEPGRIKRGMGPDPTHESALIPGRSYRLDVRTGGRVLSKVFDVLPPAMEPLLETDWQVRGPPVRSRRPLKVAFDRVMDDAIVAQEVQVQGADGLRLPGVQALSDDGRRLVFHPDNRWEDAEHRLVFSRRFEDVCGNRFDEALDHLLAARQRSRNGALSFRPCLDGALRGAECAPDTGMRQMEQHEVNAR
jgi:hypothetical protein